MMSPRRLQEASENLSEHGVDSLAASTVFADPLEVTTIMGGQMRRLVALVVLLVASSATVHVAQAVAQRSDSTRLLLTGGVEVQFRGVSIRADQVETFMDESRFVASGNVVVALPAGRTAERQVNLPDESRVVLSGGVVIVSEGVRLTADRVEVDRSTGTLHAASVEVVAVTP